LGKVGLAICADRGEEARRDLHATEYRRCFERPRLPAAS
jgi:hypothetical protein